MKADGIHDLADDSSDQKSFWRRMPIIGWMLGDGDGDWARRARPIVQGIHRQMLLRSACPNVWGGDARRAEFALWLCKRNAEQIDWRSDCFIPDDPIDVLLWEHVFGAGDTPELAMDIQDRLKIKLKSEDVSSWFGHTLEELVDLLLAGGTAFT